MPSAYSTTCAFAGSNFRRAANWTGDLAIHEECDSVAEVQGLLQFEPKLLECFPMAFEEGIEAVGASGRQSVLTDPDANRLKVAQVRG